ncbi:bifunctional 3-(3-hydroxy-phenyl)propionate/3-hydroxycinnamic acid hydroxylase [Pusillimonas caeni]|uniref:bifunctional 3-(3-hydroxy-phenyl)propionate/3-hydroxycinnamic acid hydroxylase MhpA n=1 Tax=Pusillimonas caeni TaxID=1348472 RepID=UPI000E5998DD|nr:bifunctional 3-(3-hydroxy-phenyl)propionate/3-hydroxycinnamic acid hydroxylase [Pusillimonas caeni]TFL14516.1 bifunctional 3-(3-hydroxy-phenyl)propionate/3-hydroxycinnamic acid hydroxylase [Pusillimonas caeni]
MLVDVAIVGLGPVGATLAGLLGKLGLSVAVFEREASYYPLPRAVHFDGESMRVFQAIGIADEILPHTLLTPGMKYVNAEGKLLVDWPRSWDVGPQGWHASYRFHQPDLERVLSLALPKLPSIQRNYRCDVFSLEESERHVTLRYEDLSCGKLHSLQAKYVVGCDGARSIVRRFIGSEMQDLGLHERWLVFDALLKRPWNVLGDHTVQFCDPSRPTTYVRGVGNRRRWEIMLLPDDDAGEIVRPEKIWTLLSRWITPQDADLERGVVYTFHSVLANQWRKKRLLLAGDSAHQTPPFLGQGLCSGIRDAANLAWKLRAVIRGQLHENLLDTYQAERRPHTAKYIEQAVQMGNLIQAREPEAVAERDKHLSEHPKLMTNLDLRLGRSLLNNGRDGAGLLSRQPLLGSGKLMDDIVGQHFVIISLPEAFHPSSLRELCAPLPVRVVCLEADTPQARAWLQEANAKAAVIRPDRYLMGYAGGLDAVQNLLAPLKALQAVGTAIA